MTKITGLVIMVMAFITAIVCIILKIKVKPLQDKKRSLKGEFLLALSLMIAFFTGLFTSSGTRANTVISGYAEESGDFSETEIKEKIRTKWNEANKYGVEPARREEEKREMEYLLSQVVDRGEISQVTSEAIIYMYGIALNSAKKESTPPPTCYKPVPADYQTPCYGTVPLDYTPDPAPSPVVEPESSPTPGETPVITCYIAAPIVTPPPTVTPTPTAVATPDIHVTCYMLIVPTIMPSPPPGTTPVGKKTPTVSPTPALTQTPHIAPTCYIPIIPPTPQAPPTLTPTPVSKENPTPDDGNMCYFFYRFNSNYSININREELEKKLALTEEIEAKGTIDKEIISKQKETLLEKLELLNMARDYRQAGGETWGNPPETGILLHLYEENMGGIKDGNRVQEDLIKAVAYVAELEGDGR